MAKAHILPENQKTYFGHPQGLFLLFFTEMWERFSYYGMRALLTLYMVNYLFKDPEKANQVFGFNALRGLLETGFGPLETQPLASQMYGLYTGFVYLSPFFGGIIADKIWGQRKTVYAGAILMAIGHFMMAFENMFLFALLFIILGNGAFKPNISTQVGNFYKPGDPRRDGAFTIFYMGVNLGAFFSPLVCGSLGQIYGWHYGFSAAGVGMIAGLIIYHLGRHLLPKDKHEELRAGKLVSKKEQNTMLAKTVGGFFGVAALFFIFLVLPMTLKAIIAVATIAGILYAINQLKGDEKPRVATLSLIYVVTIAFWAIYEQQGNTLQLWADEKTDWVFFGWPVPSSWYQAFNPAMIFLFAPFLDMLWNAQAKKGGSTSSVRKMGIGCLLCGLAFIIMIIAAKVVGEGPEKGNLLWLVGTTFVFTMGELYLSPIGLSLVTKVAPPRMVSMMMGGWFLSSFLGNYMSGYLGSFYSSMSKDMFFLMMTAIGVGAGLVFFTTEKRLRKVIGDA